MAHPFVHGPVHVFAALGPSSSATYLGTGERAPRVSIRREWEPLFNDIGGTRIPFDYAFQGEEAFVTIQLTRWNQSTLTALKDVIGNAQGRIVPGTTADGDIGSLMATENLGRTLWVQYAYGAGQLAPHAAMSDMVPGYRFPCAFLQGPDDSEGGTDPAKELVTFHAIRQYNPSTRKFTLFDYVLTGLPLPD